MSHKQQVCILGATGSIGLNTLDVIKRHPDRYEVFAITAYRNLEVFVDLCQEYIPKYAVLADMAGYSFIKERFSELKLSTELLVGEDSLEYVSAHDDVDIVMAAIIGAAGLKPSLAAARSGKKLLLANKESLVMSGNLFIQAVNESGATLLPIDSEHNAIYQCLPSGYTCGDKLGSDVCRLLLTASGGPFRLYDAEALGEVTPEQACAHPNWSMGPKISVDSATLMNKGLELIEACWLFGIDPEAVDVHVHPESIVHSMVEYRDGSVLAQMGSPDMRTPIAYGLAWPERIESGAQSLNLFDIASLNFEKPKEELFPCLQLARRAFTLGGTACALLNAANEEAVAAFLKGNIRFTQIPDIITRTLDEADIGPVDSVECVLNADQYARQIAQRHISLIRSH